jgi:SpoVK/Ycf46/Vps4 family AAA+-type ATPase
VWEAARKVFIYPENWLEPEQRLAPALRTSLLGIAAMICPDCYIKTKSRSKRARVNTTKSARLKGVRLLFVAKKLDGSLAGAQLLAQELDRDLYRINLREVVSKYIGETEKNLSAVFRAARSENVILFFDEADALFGKRTQVHDAHGRYADIEVNYLLHRMEHHARVSILRFASRKHMSRPSLRRFHYEVEVGEKLKAEIRNLKPKISGRRKN